VRIRVTPSARAELLATVVRLRDRNRAAAVRFVDRVEDSLRSIAEGDREAPELASPWRSSRATADHRLYLRERTGGLWLIAIWPEPSLRDEQPRRS
jgi:hypothetical protein